MSKDLAILTVLLAALSFFLGLPVLSFAILVFLAYMIANDLKILNDENIRLSKYNTELNSQIMIIKYGRRYNTHYNRY